MGFNFRKSFSLGNGVRVTVGKKSASVSVGRKGVRGSISTTGKATGTVSIPGTGLSYSTSKKISDLIPGKKDEGKKTTSTAKKTAAAKKPTAKASSAKTTASAAKKPAAKTSATAKKTTAAKTTAAKTTAKTTAAKTTAAKPAAEKTETAAPSNPFATGKAKKLTED